MRLINILNNLYVSEKDKAKNVIEIRRKIEKNGKYMRIQKK